MNVTNEIDEIVQAKIEQVKHCRTLFHVLELLNGLTGMERDEVEAIAAAARTYGGAEIDAAGVYSWDPWGVLVFDERDGFVIVPRADVLS